MINNKAQFDFPIITFIVLSFGLLIFAPVLLHLITEIRNPVGSAFGNMTSNGGQTAQTNSLYVFDSLINSWDKVMVFAYFVAIFLLFVSAVFIDTNPFFIIIYIFMCFMLVIFSANFITAIDNLYTGAFAAEAAQLTFMDFLRSYYAETLLGVIIITGIIIYGKISLFSSGGTR